MYEIKIPQWLTQTCAYDWQEATHI